MIPMNRRAFLKAIGSAALLPMLPRRLLAAHRISSRRRPSDATWPSPAAWKQLNDAVGGNLIPVELSSFWHLIRQPRRPSLALEEPENPYFIRDQPGLTETLGWVDAWATKPSVYAVAARNAQDIAAAVNFARENDLRLVVKGGGHSYQGTSNAPDSLLIWTRHMHDIEMHDAFVPQGCEHTMQPQPAVTVGAGTIGMQAYDAVTTEGGKYVQGGGCTTVCLGGLIQSGGFGSLLEALRHRGGKLARSRSTSPPTARFASPMHALIRSVLGAQRRRRRQLRRGEQDDAADARSSRVLRRRQLHGQSRLG